MIKTTVEKKFKLDPRKLVFEIGNFGMGYLKKSLAVGVAKASVLLT